uniref:E3 ubiquitin-protein ligase RGLG2-like n=1 Tax=Erigeron canadensis TaxID=72917 RepID=UPI001CB8B003|nr:E3 ubiquitin-protein ligase RGLG2-like [Erigeron canadensis]
MGGKNSREEGSRYRHSSSFQSNSGYPQFQPSYSFPTTQAEQTSYPVEEEPSYPSTSSYGTQQQPPYPYNNRPQKKLDKKYSRIADTYTSLEQVTGALGRAGLESSNLIVGIDFTKSNEWTGKMSFNRKSLHHIGDGFNPYEQAISIIGKTLAAFDEDNLIPCYGFGDASTHDQDVFSFYPEDRFCNGFEDVLSRYREIVPHLKLSGPTSFAPVIEQAMTIVEQSAGQYHVLLIIADGQVTRSVDTEHGRLSPQEQRTVDAIVEASKLPLSIVLVGVGDGPWDMMKEFDDNIPDRAFDNFQFVNFTEIMSKNVPTIRKETEFALSALMEIPSQYKATIELNLLGGRKGISPQRVALPPPIRGPSSYSSPKPSYSTSFQKGSEPYYDYGHSSPVYSTPLYGHSNPVHSTPLYGQTSPDHTTLSKSTYDNQLCPICLTNVKNMAFGCGHQTCHECGETLQLCPICRSLIETRIKLY